MTLALLHLNRAVWEHSQVEQLLSATRHHVRLVAVIAVSAGFVLGVAFAWGCL